MLSAIEKSFRPYRFGRAPMTSLNVMLACLLLSSATFAQTPDDIRRALKNGDKVSVTDEQGRQVNGRVTQLTDTAVTLRRSGALESVPYTQVIRIDRKDGLGNGALIGLGVGAVLGALAVIPTDCSPEAFFCSDPELQHYLGVAAIFGGLGAAIGTGIDALIGGDRNVYQRGRPRVAVSLGPRGARATMAISW